MGTIPEEQLTLVRKGSWQGQNSDLVRPRDMRGDCSHQPCIRSHQLGTWPLEAFPVLPWLSFCLVPSACHLPRLISSECLLTSHSIKSLKTRCVCLSQAKCTAYFLVTLVRFELAQATGFKQVGDEVLWSAGTSTDFFVLLWYVHRPVCEEHRNWKKKKQEHYDFERIEACSTPMDFNGL